MKGRNRAKMMVYGLIDTFFFARICTDMGFSHNHHPDPPPHSNWEVALPSQGGGIIYIYIYIMYGILS